MITTSASMDQVKAAKRLGGFERYLSVWVLVCMVAGVTFGRVFPQLTAALSQLEFGKGSQVNVAIGSVAAKRCSIFFSIGIDHGSISNCDDHVATCASTSLNVISCVEAMLLADATSSARNAVARSDASLVSLDDANPQPLPTSTRTPIARSTTDER